MLAYESRLDADPRWALSEGSRHFEQRSAVQDNLRAVARRLDEIGVPYAISGGMALFYHGYRRFTNDVDVLVTRQGLAKVYESLVGRGSLPAFAGGKNLRDTQTGVRIDFLIAGDYPGDGKPKPVAFPDPSEPQCTVEADGIRYLDLVPLMEVKLASGVDSPANLSDLCGVLELIRLLVLPTSCADGLSPAQRGKLLKLHCAANGAQVEVGFDSARRSGHATIGRL